MCVVPHSRKFCNPSTGDLIAESARVVQDFSGLKAAQAFQELERYAANIINQPWRREYWEIKVFSRSFELTFCSVFPLQRISL